MTWSEAMGRATMRSNDQAQGTQSISHPQGTQATELLVRHGEDLGFPSTRNSSYPKKRMGQGPEGEGKG